MKKRVSENLFNKRGITLVELIISIALVSLVIASAFSLFVFGDSTFRGGTAQHNLQNDMRFAIEELTDDLRYATELEILSGFDSNSLDPFENYIYYEAGEIVKLRYGRTERRIPFNTDEEKPLKFEFATDKIIITASGINEMNNKSYELDINIELLNINGLKGKLQGEDIENSSGFAVKYSTPNDYLGYTQAPIFSHNGDSEYFEATLEGEIVSYDVKVMDADGNEYDNFNVVGPNFDGSETTLRITKSSDFNEGDRIELWVTFSASVLEDAYENFDMVYRLSWNGDAWGIDTF